MSKLKNLMFAMLIAGTYFSFGARHLMTSAQGAEPCGGIVQFGASGASCG